MQVVKKWKAPESVLLHHRQTSFPTAPETGLVGVVVNAMASNPIPPSMACPLDESVPDNPAANQVNELLTQSSRSAK
jgi:hypothetical protein